MIYGAELFFSLFNNLAIFIALVAIYGYVLIQFKESIWFRRQTVLGLSFGVVAIGCMYAKIPVFEGVIVDQRNAIVALSGAFGGPLSALISAVFAGTYRVYLGGDGAFAGVVGVSLAATSGIVLNKFPRRFASMKNAGISALIATIIILPGFLFVKDFQTGWGLMKAMALPYGFAIFCGIFLAGLLLNREDDRYQFELSYRESEEKYRELIEGTQDLITHVDRHGNFTFVNHVAKKILGIMPEESIGMSAFEFIHPDDRDMTIEWFNNGVAQKKKQSKLENRQINVKTGELHTVFWSSSFHFNDSGELTGIGSIGRDITQTRTAEQNYQNLFDKMPDGYVIYDIIYNDTGQPVDYRFLKINPAYEKLTGRKAADLIGKTLLEVFPNKIKKWMDIVGEIVLKDEPAMFEYFFEKQDKHFEMTAYKLEQNRFACLSQDITLRKKAEKDKRIVREQLRHSQKMEAIGTLSGGIAHDFNNILTTVLGYADMAKGNIPDGNLAKNQIDAVIKAGNRAKDLVKQILAFSHKAEESLLPVDVQLLINETISFLRATIPSSIKIESNITPDCGYILADPTQIHQILMNLCTNSSHAMEDESGVLYIDSSVVELQAKDLENGSFQKPGFYILLSVRDTGSGIEEELLDRIFDPFFTTKEVGEGTGMGLSVVHGIVKRHKGIIKVESMPGKGTTFKLFFPRIETSPHEEPEHRSLFPVGKENILIVDDDVDIANLTRKRVEVFGYTATAMTNSLKALELFRSDPGAYDLLITDQTMPDMTGEQLAKELLTIRPDIPIIMCTGYSSKIDANKANKIGINGFLMKPFDNAELTKTIRQVLDV